jgi:ABC-type transport system substrate-binding protein
MKHTKLTVVLGLIVIATMLLSACQPQTVIQTVEVVKEVEKVVKETQVVEVEKTVEKTQIVEVERKSFTTPHPILGDLKVRQAMAYCTNKVDLARAGYPLLTEEQAQALVMDTMIPKSHWAYAGDENITLYPYDTAKGGALLDEAGWTLAEGDSVRYNADGVPLALKFTTTNAAFRQAWAAVWEAQMAECGIQILRSHVPSSWWFGDTTGLAVRDFEIGAYAWVGQADPGGTTLWTCNQIPLPENNWVGQNYMGWCNEAASKATYAANNTLVKEDRIKNFLILQQEYTKDVPAIPIFNRTETFSHVAGLTGFDPKPGEEYYTYNVADWEIPGKDTIVMAFTQEPASLYTTVESGFTAVLAASLMGFPRAHTTLNYTYEPLYLTELPTVESGLALNNEVEVKAGDKVVDATGEVVELANGMKIVDSTGAEVEFSGSPVKVHQLVVTYDWIDDITWQDGKKISKGDFELSYKTVCDKESGATTFYTCDRIAGIVFDDDSKYTVTYLPGYQNPEYFAAPYGPSPAHQPIESGEYAGKTLADVPAKDWPTLVEVAEKPYSYGPYMITNWVKGEKLEYEANPYYYKGAPKTPKMVIQIVTAENAESQLLTGQVDVLGSETLAGLTEQLVAAEEAGKVKNIVNAGATWEHIDFNLFVK